MPWKGSFRAVMARWPWPSSETFSGRAVSNSSWPLPQPSPLGPVPTSKRHRAGSGACRAAPSNSSCQTTCHGSSEGPQRPKPPSPAAITASSTFLSQAREFIRPP
jgi:hypothetical protein